MKNYLLTLASSIDVSPLPGAKTPGGLATTDEIKLILGIIFGIVGALCLLVITISGLRYVTSVGDPKQITQAKDGIVYALIGLVIVISAQAIVAFVIGNVG